LTYRNINRIFQALHHETIGKYIKRRRLEKACEYLKYSKNNISDIAVDIGFSDIAAFSKAFKSKYNCSPSAFRKSSESMQKMTKNSLFVNKKEGQQIQFEIEELPEFEMLYLQYRGSYENIDAIKQTWEQLGQYAYEKKLLNKNTIFMAEILDDNKISDSVNCRYNTAIILEKPLSFSPDGLFKTKTNSKQKYAKFLHKGSHESCADTYHNIYANWMSEVNWELEDKAVLEFYLNDESNTPSAELLTEIYIPVM